MNTDVHDGINYLMSASDLDELRQIFERLMCKFGFDLFALQFTPNSYKTMDIKPVALANYDRAWVNHYFEQAYHLIDPVVTIGSKMKKPFLWSDTWRDTMLSKKQHVLFNEAKDYGVANGIGIPVLSPYHENGMVTLVSSIIDDAEVKQVVFADAPSIQLLCVYFQQMAHYFIVRDNIKVHSIPLTEREKDCLRWAAQGKSNGDIAMIVGLSVRTVEWHFANCCRKLNAVSREQAVAKAIITKSIDI